MPSWRRARRACAELEAKARKTARYRAQQIYHWVYQRFVFDWDQMTDLSKDLRAWLKENVEIFRLKDKFNKQALDGTHKFLWELGRRQDDRKRDHPGRASRKRRGWKLRSCEEEGRAFCGPPFDEPRWTRVNGRSADRLHLEPGGLRDGVQVLPHRHSRPGSPSSDPRDRHPGDGAQAHARRSRTSCSWAWASRCTILRMSSRPARFCSIRTG